MRIVFVAIGWENISLQALSSVLKENGHEVHLVYDQSLFDDKNYLSIKWLANIFDQKKLVIQRIIELEPDLIGFHVQTVQYQEMKLMASELKKYCNVPIIFGGIHPHSAPNEVLLKEDNSVDIICLGEGEFPLLELCNTIDAGKVDYSIKNLWFRLEGGLIIKNEMRPLIKNLDELPTIDKNLFSPHFPMKYSYLSCPSRGCPYACSYCSLSFLGNEAKKLGGSRVRERSVDSLVNEIKIHVNKYKSKWVDFRQPVMSASQKWTIEFCKKYKKEIGLPFRCFSHPLLIKEDSVKALKEAGCFGIQIGIESWDEDIRKIVLNRNDTNNEILEATNILERIGQKYAYDYILGLPRIPIKNENGDIRPPTEKERLESVEKELIGFANFIAPLKFCYRIAPFMIQYMPGTSLIQHGIDAGELDEVEIDKLKNGLHDNYMSGGSIISNPKRLRLLNGYRVMFRLMSFMPPWCKKIMLKLKLYKIFWMAPFKVMISLLDILIAIRDKDATTYAKNYVWWIKKRFDPDYHLYLFRKKKKFPKVEKVFELPLNGVLKK